MRSNIIWNYFHSERCVLLVATAGYNYPMESMHFLENCLKKCRRTLFSVGHASLPEMFLSSPAFCGIWKNKLPKINTNFFLAHCTVQCSMSIQQRRYILIEAKAPPPPVINCGDFSCLYNCSVCPEHTVQLYRQGKVAVIDDEGGGGVHLLQ